MRLGRVILAAAAALLGVALSRSRGAFAWSTPAEPFGTRGELATGCTPWERRPGVEAFRRWVLARHGGRDGGIWRDCALGGTSEHHEGRAWDWMIDTAAEAAEADRFAAELTEGPAELARRAGLLYLIWQRRIWRAYDPRGWSTYTGPHPHTDHVHFSFTRAGAAGSTSLYEAIA